MAVILNIEMPINCYDCPCCDKDSGWCQVTGKAIFIERPHDCPLVEEKHGHWLNSKSEIATDFECPVWCSECAHWADTQTPCCPNCGAIMDEEIE